MRATESSVGAMDSPADSKQPSLHQDLATGGGEVGAAESRRGTSRSKSRAIRDTDRVGVPLSRRELLRIGAQMGVVLAIPKVLSACTGTVPSSSGVSATPDSSVELSPTATAITSDHVPEFFGSNAGSYLDYAVTNHEAGEYLLARAQAFRVGDTSVPLPISGQVDSYSLGGDLTNELMVLGLIDPAPAELLNLVSAQAGVEVGAMNAGSVFVAYRFFDAVASKEAGVPLIGHAGAVFTSVEPEGQPASLFMADGAGVTLLFTAREAEPSPSLSQPSSPSPAAAALDDVIPPRANRVTAYVSALVGYGSDGSKVYAGIASASPAAGAPIRSNYHGISGVAYEQVELTDPAPNPPDEGTPAVKVTRESSLADTVPAAKYEVTVADSAVVIIGDAQLGGGGIPEPSFDVRQATCSGACDVESAAEYELATTGREICLTAAGKAWFPWNLIAAAGCYIGWAIACGFIGSRNTRCKEWCRCGGSVACPAA
jgi:hypothetical protein